MLPENASAKVSSLTLLVVRTTIHLTSLCLCVCVKMTCLDVHEVQFRCPMSICSSASSSLLQPLFVVSCCLDMNRSLHCMQRPHVAPCLQALCLPRRYFVMDAMTLQSKYISRDSRSHCNALHLSCNSRHSPCRIHLYTCFHRPRSPCLVIPAGTAAAAGTAVL